MDCYGVRCARRLLLWIVAAPHSPPAHPGGFRCPEASERLNGVALHVDLAAVLEALESEVALLEPDR